MLRHAGVYALFEIVVALLPPMRKVVLRMYILPDRPDMKRKLVRILNLTGKSTNSKASELTKFTKSRFLGFELEFLSQFNSVNSTLSLASVTFYAALVF